MSQRTGEEVDAPPGEGTWLTFDFPVSSSERLARSAAAHVKVLIGAD